MADRLFDKREVAGRLKVSMSTVGRLLRTGELPAVRLGALIRIRERDLDTFLDALAARNPPEPAVITSLLGSKYPPEHVPSLLAVAELQ